MITEDQIIVIGPRDRKIEGTVVNTTSKGGWSSELSPFLLGPVMLADRRIAKNVENGWQYSKLYKEFADENGNPTPRYWEWSQKGMSKSFADRYPMGKGARPLCSILGNPAKYEKLLYVEARKQIYLPLYRDAVVKTQAFEKCKEILQKEGKLILWDFDGYNRGDKTLKEVLNDPTRIMGHAFVLAMALVYGSNFDPENL